MRIHTQKQQQGSALVWLVSLTMIVGMLALVVELSQIYLQKRQLQTVANSLASIVVEQNQSCTSEVLQPGNIDVTYDSAMKQRLLSANPSLVKTVNSLTNVSIKRVYFEQVNGVYRVLGLSNNALQSNGVAVSIESPMPLLLGFFKKSIGDNTVISAHTAARKEVAVVLSGMGSVANVQDGLLGNLLATLLGVPSTSLTNIDDLRNLTFSLGELLGDTPLGLLESVRLDILLGNIVANLDRTDPLVEIIESILNTDPVSSILTKSVNLNDVIKVVHSGPLPTEINMPAYDTIIALVMNVLSKAVGDPIELQLDVFPSQLVSTKIYLEIKQSPTIAIGPARQNQQGEWMTRADFAALTLKLDLGLSVLGLISLPLKVNVEVGGGDASLVGGVCASGSRNESKFIVDTNSNLLFVEINSNKDDLEIEDSNLRSLINIDLESNGPILSINKNNNNELVWSDFLEIGSNDEYSYKDDYKISEIKLNLPKIKISLKPSAMCSSLPPLLKNICEIPGTLLNGVLDVVMSIVNGVTSLLDLENLLEGAIGDVLIVILNLLEEILLLLGVSLGDAQVSLNSPVQNGFSIVECSVSCINQ